VIVASAVVHNEAGRYLDLWLDHLLSFCDEVRILDDGSTDATPELLARERVVVHRQPERTFFVHEAQTRNRLLRHTARSECEYVLSIDADEFVADPAKVVAAAEGGHAAYWLAMREVWWAAPKRLGLRTDGLWGPRPCPVLWRKPPAHQMHGQRWQVLNRRLACGREPLAVRRAQAMPTGTDLLHFGWTRTSERQARAERYFTHDRGRYHADRHLQSILWPDERVGIARMEWPEALVPIARELATRAEQ
jgi:glycosyltransferase involved in cell wall biosynthesis